MAIGIYIPSGGVCVLLEPLMGEIFNCCPLFHDFSWMNGDKIENSKTIVSTTDTYPNILRKFLPKNLQQFLRSVVEFGAPYAKMGDFSKN